ncbi:hypothetical protein [Gilliamella apis]|uniref:hypothetical protein n=1 Tax=Gilliamella apis TaxID=1970738 RepID=UPI00274239BE|nr:hypothetical protein [Gilliamella apis]WLT07098.1 hypothetical protein RAM11_02950 [Gilliamella apis]
MMDSQRDLSFTAIFQQTINFIRNRFSLIALSCIVLGLINTLVINSIINPKQLMAELELFNQYGIISDYVIRSAIILYLVNTVLVSIILSIICNLSMSNKLNPSLIFSQILPICLNILGFSVLYMLICIPIVILFLLVLSIIGLLLPQMVSLLLILVIGCTALVIYKSIFNYFLVSAAQPNTMPFFQRFSACHKFFFQNWKAPVLMILISVIFTGILSGISSLLGKNIVFDVISTSLAVFADFFIFSFFYRLYSVNNNIESTKSDDNNKLIIS